MLKYIFTLFVFISPFFSHHGLPEDGEHTENNLLARCGCEDDESMMPPHFV